MWSEKISNEHIKYTEAIAVVQGRNRTVENASVYIYTQIAHVTHSFIWRLYNLNLYFGPYYSSYSSYSGEGQVVVWSGFV